MGMGKVVPLQGADPALVLTNPGVQFCNLRQKPFTSLHTRPSVRSDER
jgi:hypothetical protein